MLKMTTFCLTAQVSEFMQCLTKLTSVSNTTVVRDARFSSHFAYIQVCLLQYISAHSPLPGLEFRCKNNILVLYAYMYNCISIAYPFSNSLGIKKQYNLRKPSRNAICLIACLLLVHEAWTVSLCFFWGGWKLCTIKRWYL